jgi:hypothetical protein
MDQDQLQSFLGAASAFLSSKKEVHFISSPADAEKVRHSIRQLAAIDPEEWRKLVDPTASSLEKPPIHRQDQKQ